MISNRVVLLALNSPSAPSPWSTWLVRSFIPCVRALPIISSRSTPPQLFIVPQILMVSKIISQLYEFFITIPFVSSIPTCSKKNVKIVYIHFRTKAEKATAKKIRIISTEMGKRKLIILLSVILSSPSFVWKSITFIPNTLLMNERGRKILVMMVKSMIERPCVTDSSARFSAYLASTIEVCCCLRLGALWATLTCHCLS